VPSEACGRFFGVAGDAGKELRWVWLSSGRVCAGVDVAVLLYPRRLRFALCAAHAFTPPSSAQRRCVPSHPPLWQMREDEGRNLSRAVFTRMRRTSPVWTSFPFSCNNLPRFTHPLLPLYLLSRLRFGGNSMRTLRTVVV